MKQSELLDAIVDALGVEDGRRVSSRGTAELESSSSIRPLRILLAEDGIANQKLALGLLKKWGHSVTIANNGCEALDHYRARAFDAVLMDVRMPEMDGLQATQAIRDHELSTGRHVPVIAMTAHAMKGDREMCIEAGMDDYVTKPIRSDALRSVLEHFFADTASTEPPTSQEREVTGCVDWSAALGGVQDDTEILRITIEAALVECPRLAEELSEALRNNDVEIVHRIAHTLKGTLRIFEASATASAQDLESLAASGSLDGAEDLWRQLQPQMDAFLAEIGQWLKKNGG